MKAHCERIHGPCGCDETTVKELVEVFSDATVTLGGAAVGIRSARIRGDNPAWCAERTRTRRGDNTAYAPGWLGADRNLLTGAGRSVQKHGDRVGSPFRVQLERQPRGTHRGSACLWRYCEARTKSWK